MTLRRQSTDTRRKKGIDHGAVPRPVNMVNQTDVRYGIPDRFEAIATSFDVPPSAALPFYQVDKGQSGPRFV